MYNSVEAVGLAFSQYLQLSKTLVRDGLLGLGSVKIGCSLKPYTWY
jgi:hypothetical protein